MLLYDSLSGTPTHVNLPISLKDCLNGALVMSVSATHDVSESMPGANREVRIKSKACVLFQSVSYLYSKFHQT